MQAEEQLSDRREFIRQCAAAGAALLLHPAAGAQAPGTSATPMPRAAAPPRQNLGLAPFAQPLPALPRIHPSGRGGGGAVRYHVRMMELRRRLHPGLPPTRLWGYNGLYPGPLFEVERGVPVEVEWENALPAEHLLPVDPRIHGAMPPAPAVRVVPHLHGSRTDSISDGLPERWFVPGRSVVYHYPNQQPAATLWYHDHALGITRLNVYAGLSGMYLIRDAGERALGLPAGEYEIPLILQDRTLGPDGQLLYLPTMDDAMPLPRATWGPMFFGELAVVNGAVAPCLEVEPRPYRLRLLNACNSRFVRLCFNLARHVTDIPDLLPAHQIGSDGGLLPAPVRVVQPLLGPGERADLVVDFSALAGKTVTLCNDASAPFPGWNVLGAQWPEIQEFMQFRVGRPTRPAAPFALPARVPFAGLDRASATRHRDFILSEQMDANGRSVGLRINGRGYDDPVTETVEENSVETWRFINTSDDAHPMHLHLVQFQVLERQGFSMPVMLGSGRLQAEGLPRRPGPGEEGWKDTAIVRPGEMLTILVKFEGFTGRYVFHCHMLEHEDNDMMRPFEVVARPAPAQG